MGNKSRSKRLESRGSLSKASIALATLAHAFAPVVVAAQQETGIVRYLTDYSNPDFPRTGVVLSSIESMSGTVNFEYCDKERALVDLSKLEESFEKCDEESDIIGPLKFWQASDAIFTLPVVTSGYKEVGEVLVVRTTSKENDPYGDFVFSNNWTRSMSETGLENLSISIGKDGISQYSAELDYSIKHIPSEWSVSVNATNSFALATSDTSSKGAGVELMVLDAMEIMPLQSNSEGVTALSAFFKDFDVHDGRSSDGTVGRTAQLYDFEGGKYVHWQDAFKESDENTNFSTSIWSDNFGCQHWVIGSEYQRSFAMQRLDKTGEPICY